MNPSSRAWPVAGLVFNAFVWGLAWWPLRFLQEQGLHPLWATAGFFLVGLCVLGVMRPASWGQVWRSPLLWGLALATGATNAAFNWGVTVGEVVRVVLLFYLMPLWSAALAWWLLDERLSRAAAVRVVLALGGAFLVLMPSGGPWPEVAGLGDVLGLLGGMGFALTNVLLRKAAPEPSSARGLAMFAGGLSFPLVLALALHQAGEVGPLPPLATPWLLGVLGMGLMFVASNLALQAGATRLPVRITSVIMLTEIVFATTSSVLFGQEVLTARMLLGGALIFGASLLSALDDR